MTIKINNTDYKIKQTIRALFAWEQVTGKSFEIKTTLDNYLYFYCLLLVNNEDFMSWENFLNALDEDPTIILNLSKALTESQSIEKLLNPDTEDSTESDKKKD